MAQTPNATLPSPTPPPIDAEWTCKLAKLDPRGQPAGDITAENPLTVGERFHMACGGPSVELERDHLSLELPKDAKYSLRILETRALTADRGEFVAVTWTGAPVEFKQLFMSDGKHRIDLGAVKLETKSVIPKEKAAEQKPYDPFGPVYLNLPLYVWLVVLLLASAFGLWVFALVRKSLRRKRLLTLLNKNKIAVSPYHHFNKELRRLNRQTGGDPQAYIKELGDGFRWYLARELVIPAFEQTPAKIVRTIGKQYPDLQKKAVARDLYLALTEIEKASGQKVSHEDIHQITELCRTLADRIHAAREA